MSEALDTALAAFAAHSPRFLSESENTVYAVERDGHKAALRLHRPGYQGADEIWSELWWMDALAQYGLRVPAPLPARDGALLVTLASGRMASMVSWVEGAPMYNANARDPALFRLIGETLARLHNITDTLDLPAHFRRHAWDVDGLMGEAPFWGRFWENPTLSAPERVVILEARDMARARLTRFCADGGDFGLIHADAIRGNVFVDRGRVTLIDFDDCGFGFRLYDLAVLMTQNQDMPNAAALQQAALDGYRTQRALPDDAEEIITLLVMARRMASMGWIVPRSDVSDPRRRIYAERAVAAAGRFLTS